jgi:hypothetical protein
MKLKVDTQLSKQDLRQAALFGVGLAASMGGTEFAPFAHEAVQVSKYPNKCWFSLGETLELQIFIEHETRYPKFPETGLAASMGGTEFAPLAREATPTRPCRYIPLCTFFLWRGRIFSGWEFRD